MKSYIMLIIVIIMVFAPINSQVYENDPPGCVMPGLYYTTNSIGCLTTEVLAKTLVYCLVGFMIIFIILI